MADRLTSERRAELRELLDSIGYDNSEPLRDWMMGHLSGRTHAAMVDGAVNALPALLDVADERDRLAAAVERVQALHAPEPFEMPNGEVWYRCGRCQHASSRPCPTRRALDGTDE